MSSESLSALAMARLSALLALTLAAVAVSAKPIVIRDAPVTLAIARRFNTTGVVNLLKADQSRAQVLKARSQASDLASTSALDAVLAADVDVPVTNGAVVYTASVGVGSPATTYDLIIDTGSSNTWIGAGKSYVKTSTSVDTGARVVSLSQPPYCVLRIEDVSHAWVGTIGGHLWFGQFLRGGVHGHRDHRLPRHRKPGRWRRQQVVWLLRL